MKAQDVKECVLTMDTNVKKKLILSACVRTVVVLGWDDGEPQRSTSFGDLLL